MPSDDEKKHGDDARGEYEKPTGGKVGHGGGGGGEGKGLGRTEVMRLAYAN